jgi:hypothetical protein
MIVLVTNKAVHLSMPRILLFVRYVLRTKQPGSRPVLTQTRRSSMRGLIH